MGLPRAVSLSRLLGPAIIPLGLLGHPDDEFRLASRVRHPVLRQGGREPKLQDLVFLGHFRLLDQIISEEEPVPVLGEIGLHHVDVVRAFSRARISLDEPCVERRAVVPVCGAPEVIVALSSTGAIRSLVASRSDTSTSMSTIGFAARPGTPVVPKCSMR